ncbi:LemA family protein [Candidatus Omnitrophota bacterium]
MIIAIIVIFLVVFGMVLFNKLIRLRALMREAWSGIDVQLKRRHDLIPNIVVTVKGYAKHEKNTLEQVIKLRTEITGTKTVAEKGVAENNLSGMLKSIFALAEAYPDLKANKGFLELQNNLIEIEDNIQLARRYYNGTVRNFNIAVQTVPSNIVAGLFNFKAADFFEIEYATERKTPDVKFTT